MSVIDDIITDVIRREAGYSNDPADGGGRTDKGISERSHPDAWADGKVTDQEARDIYLKKYVLGPGFDKIPDPHLMAHLVDYGVNSGPLIAVQKLQTLVGADVDGVLGPQTLGKLAQFDMRTINNLLVGERVRMIGRIVKKNPSQLTFLNGWLARATEFLR